MLQTNGIATGAPNSCSYAAIGVTSIDNAVLDQKATCFNDLVYFGRHKHGCFSLWKRAMEKLESFYNFLNSLNPGLKFTMQVGCKSIFFLDLKINIVNGQLETTVYSKPTDSHLYLHARSCHKPSSIRGIQKGVAPRLRHICSTDNEYSSKSIEYQDYLTHRGHDPNTVHDTFEKISKITQNDARKKMVNNNSNINRVIFPTKFNPRGPNVTKIIKDTFHLIQNNKILNRLFPENSILVANKRENNLKDLLLRSDPYNIKKDLLDNTKHG